MKALYLHGFKSSPNKDKVIILEKYFDKVFAPKIYWEDDIERVNLFDKFTNLIISENITHVIGCSMGGEMAYRLACYCKVIGICFNPAFNYSYLDFRYKLKNGGRIKFVLGKSDEIVNPYKSIEYINTLTISNKTIVLLDMNHRVDLSIFENEIINVL